MSEPTKKKGRRGGSRESSKAKPGQLRKAVAIRLPEELTKLGKDVAKKLNMTFTALVERGLVKEIDEHRSGN